MSVFSGSGAHLVSTLLRDADFQVSAPEDWRKTARTGEKEPEDMENPSEK